MYLCLQINKDYHLLNTQTDFTRINMKTSKAKAIISALVLASSLTIPVNATVSLKPTAKAKAWADSVMTTMNDDEKIGQLFVYTTRSTASNAVKESLLRQINDNKIGGILFWKGTCEGQAELTNIAQKAAKVPLMITMDGEWGLQMRLTNTLRYPRKLTLSAMQNDSLIYKLGYEIGRQCKEMGIHVNFDPVLDVNLNPQNPVINIRAFGDNPKEIAHNAELYIKGMHDRGIICVGKHFPGHGDTQQDSHQQIAEVTHNKEMLDSVDLYPYKYLMEKDLLDGVMVGHLSVPVIDSTNTPASLSPAIVNGLLKKELGFDGLVFTDAMKMGAVSKRENAAVEALKAGIDMILDMGEGDATKKAMAKVKAAIEDSTLSMDEINEKCRKVLIYKYICGAHNFKPIDYNTIAGRLNTPTAMKTQQNVAAASVTVVNNRKSTMPLRKLEKTILITVGDRGETYFATMLSHYGSVPRYNLMADMCKNGTPEKLDSMVKEADAVIFAIHDTQVPDSILTRLTDDVKGKTIHAYFISPYLMEKYPNSVKCADATLIGYENAQCMQYACAQTIMGGYASDGKLPVNATTAYGKGKSLKTTKSRLGTAQPEDVGMSSETLKRIDDIAKEAIEDHSTPSCQILVARRGMIIYDKAFGTSDYNTTTPNLTSNIYDLASVTKLMATTQAMMKLVDEEKVGLDAHVTEYLPEMKKLRHITVRDLMMHQSGMPASMQFYMNTINKPDGNMFDKKDSAHTVQVGPGLYANTDFTFKDDLIRKTSNDTFNLSIADSLYTRVGIRDSVTKWISGIKPKEKKYVYSDINFMILQRIAERITGKSLDEYTAEILYRPIGATTTTFNPLTKFDRTRIMPTANDQFLRKQLLRGYVHDENAAFQGGVSGHAGLFSNAEDLAKICEMWLKGGEYGGHRYVSENTCREFLTEKSEISRRGLGFDRLKVEESATKEHVMMGHYGFTGTCVWIDPKEHLTYIFLSNRVNPDAWNNGLVRTNIRTRIAEIIYQSITDNK